MHYYKQFSNWYAVVVNSWIILWKSCPCWLGHLGHMADDRLPMQLYLENYRESGPFMGPKNGGILYWYALCLDGSHWTELCYA